MENVRKIRRICSYCGKNYSLTKSQMRQVKSKWPVNCSRSCARKAQHARNYKNIRQEKSCVHCSSSFIVTSCNSFQIYCSRNCSSISRFGEPGKNKKILREKIDSILMDEKYLNFIKAKSLVLGQKYNVDSDDIFQDYFLALLSGHNSFIEQTAMNTIRVEYNSGIVGKRKAKKFLVSGEALNILSKKSKKCSEQEKIELLLDLKSVLNEFEFDLASLMLFGFKANEAIKKVTCSNDKFYKHWKRLNCRDNSQQIIFIDEDC